MPKIWQILVMSLVPLALVFTGVIIGSIHGVDSGKEQFAPPPQSASGPGSGPAAAPGATSGTALKLVAQNQKYNVNALSAPASTSITVTLDNEDGGTLHNFAVYTNKNATTKIFAGDFVTGVASKDYTFSTPIAGTYYFRCDVHPDTMNGTFTVR